MTPTRGNRSLLDLKKQRQGWLCLFEICLPHYGPVSRSYATSTLATDYGGVSEAAEALAHAECHVHSSTDTVNQETIPRAMRLRPLRRTKLKVDQVTRVGG